MKQRITITIDFEFKPDIDPARELAWLIDRLHYENRYVFWLRYNEIENYEIRIENEENEHDNPNS